MLLYHTKNINELYLYPINIIHILFVLVVSLLYTLILFQSQKQFIINQHMHECN